MGFGIFSSYNNYGENEQVDNDVIILKSDEFIPWLDRKLSEKYNQSLEGIHQRLLGIYGLIKVTLEQMVVIDNILKEESGQDVKPAQNSVKNDSKSQKEKTSNYIKNKALIDNMISLLSMTCKEYTECLDIDYIEYFCSSLDERMGLFVAHKHQISHIPIKDPKIDNQIKKCIKVIDNTCSLIGKSLCDLQCRAELSVPLLRHIKECKNMFRIPLKKLHEEIEVLHDDKSYEEFNSMYEEVKNSSKGSMESKLDFINKMIDLIKEYSQYQYEINKMLKTYYSMSSLIRTKGRKLLNENLKSNDQTKLLKYSNHLLRNDFCNNVLPALDVSEMIYIIKLFEEQTNLVAEYKKTLVKGIEDYQTMNTFEFAVVVGKYKQIVEEVNEFQVFAKKNYENMKLTKDTINQILKDIKKLVDKYKVYQNGIYHYQTVLELFQKIRNLCMKFCYEEFNEKIELICEYNL